MLLLLSFFIEVVRVVEVVEVAEAAEAAEAAGAAEVDSVVVGYVAVDIVVAEV